MKKVIKTKRLILSPLEQEDSPSFIKIAQNMRQKKQKIVITSYIPVSTTMLLKMKKI